MPPAAAGRGAGKRIGILGLSFKPNTDDMREAPAITIIQGLRRRGYAVKAFDPVAMPRAAAMRELRGVEFADDPIEAARGADAVAIVTEWNEFKLLNLERLRGLMRRPLIFDGRNIYEPERMRRLGFEYHSIGRRPVYPG